MESKVCGGCEKEIPLDPSFWHMLRRGSKSYFFRCKPCWNARCKAYRESNRARVRENARASRQRNAEHYREKDRQRNATPHRKEYEKTRRIENREYFRNYAREHRLKNKERISAKRRESYADRAEIHRERARQYRLNNPEFIKDQNRRRYQADPISYALATAIRENLVSNSVVKSKSTFDHVEWSMVELKAHLLSLFDTGMSFENYGEWEIDHIIPRSKVAFSDTTDEVFRRLWSLANLAPLWRHDNRQKLASLNWQLPDTYTNHRLRALYENRDPVLLEAAAA